MRIARLRIALAVMLTIGLVIAGGELSPAAKRTNRVTVSEFQQLHGKLIKMSTQRVWSIPWQLSVRAARKLAAKQNKPVFLWISSNGGTHPLGPC